MLGVPIMQRDSYEILHKFSPFLYQLIFGIQPFNQEGIRGFDLAGYQVDCLAKL